MTQNNQKILDTSFLDKKPVGHITFYFGQRIPENYMPCHGQILNVITNPEYADLYRAIGNTYGGTDNTNFRLPTFFIANLANNRKFNTAIIKYTHSSVNFTANNSVSLIQKNQLISANCECGAKSINSNMHSNWCPKG